MPLSAGPGAGLGLVVVGSSKGTVIAVDGATGRELWRTKVNSELLSAPAISEKVVVMRSVDGRLHGFDFTERQGTLVGRTAGAALELARHGDSDHREGRSRQRLR